MHREGASGAAWSTAGNRLKENHDREVPLDPYALGLLLGDGCLTGSTTPAFATVHDVYVERGRFLIASDVNRAARVAVIGQEIAETLFPFVNPVDKEIQIDGLGSLRNPVRAE